MRDEGRRGPVGPRSSHSTFDQPLGGPIDEIAGRAATRTRSQAWAPALVTLGGLAAMAVVLIVVGEAIVHLGLLGGLRHADDQIAANLAAHRTSGWNRFSAFWSHSAETLPIVVGGLLVELVLALRRRWRDMLLVVIGLGIELATFLVVNEIVRRDRPSVDKVGIVPTTFSYPSGHTAATIVLYGSVVLLLTLHLRSRRARLLAWIPVLLVTVAVGFARVDRGMHHLSDVVIGSIMGVGALLIAVTATRSSSIAAERQTGRPPEDEADESDEGDESGEGATCDETGERSARIPARREQVPT